VHATGWSRGLEVTGGGTGIVSHAGLVLLRQLSDRTGLTAGLSAALPSPLGGHDRGRVLSDLACAIAGGARVISDFRVMGDQRELFGPVASVPTAWRALKEIAGGGDYRRRKVTAAVSKARRHAWNQGIARHGGLPPVRVADRKLEGVTCIRLDATVVTAHSGKELAEANFKGYGHHLVIAACDNVAEPLAWMLRPGSAGSNTASDHLRLLGDAITALPPALRRKLMIACDGAGASHALVKELDRLASRHGYQVTCSAGGELGAREKAAIGKVPQAVREIAADGKGEVRERRADDACTDPRCAHRACWIQEAHVAELTGLLREGPAGDQLKGCRRRCGSSPAASGPTPAPSSRCSRPPTGGATRCGRRISRLRPGAGAASALTPTPPTASTPGSRTSSAPGRTPAWGISLHTITRSTSPGSTPR